MGAKIIEKHFTLDKKSIGPDHKASLNEKELKELVKSIRNVELALGDEKKSLSKSEKKNIKIVRKSIVAKKKILKGEYFTVNNLTTKRPGTGKSPNLWDKIIGKKAKKALPKRHANLMLKRKICIITGSRSDYGIMSNFLRSIQKNKSFDLKLIVTGMYLIPRFGNTFREIENDKVKIFKKIKLPLKKDRAHDISIATSVGILKFSETLLKIKPDIVLVLGDRFESLAFSISALYLNIPIAHIHGGESTLAVIDDLN